MGYPLVIVESPAKARTIAKFLGDEFRVEASVGHVRDLPRKASEVPASLKNESWATLGVDVENGYKPLYVIPPEKKPQVKKLKGLLKDASALYLATDEDREGESISWHLLEVLKPKVPVYRLVFHEITETAIRAALKSPRSVNLDLVRAQETRRIIDRLFGYDISPLLWRKVRPQLSAGRVQSVAVRLVVERERKRIAFTSANWWSVRGPFSGERGSLEADLTTWEGSKVATGKDFGPDGTLKSSRSNRVLDEATAQGIVDLLSNGPATVHKVAERPYTDKPSAPFTTSTLQQDANRKFKWTGRRTMTVAQGLYENGWITYMRTDSTTLSSQALTAARQLIESQYGADYLPSKPRTYSKKVKNAQEAHEAVRPAGHQFRTLGEAKSKLDRDAERLYELIWKRTVASQMSDAVGKLVSISIAAGEGIFEAKGKTIEFPGFRRAYVEGSDNPEAQLSGKERILPPLREGDVIQVEDLTPTGHATKPPPRLTEANLVKELEERGIGRPSTYASIIDTIQRRKYVFKRGTTLVPTFTAFAVTGLLEGHLGWLVDYDFTAQMEGCLDQLAVGKGDPQAYLDEFYKGEGGLSNAIAQANHDADPRKICRLHLGDDDVPPADDEDSVDGKTPIFVCVGKYGPFLSAGKVRADIPEDMAPDELGLDDARKMIAVARQGPRVIGVDPESGLQVVMIKGRYGPYVQLGEQVGKVRPKRASLLKSMDPSEVGLDPALRLLALPRDLGAHPDSGEAVMVANGRHGPYVKCASESRSIPDEDAVLTIVLEEALALLAQPKRSGRRRPEPLRELGVDDSTGRTVRLMDGRFGPYVTDGESNASLRKGTDVAALDLEQAIALIRVKEAAPPRSRGRGRSRK